MKKDGVGPDKSEGNPDNEGPLYIKSPLFVIN